MKTSRFKAPAGRPAFTLLEMLVAVGAVALIALGMGRIFGATSDTLRAGRRISAFNDYAAMVERTMRNDFQAMSRDGFLVIVNENAYNPQRALNFPFGQRRGPILTSKAANANSQPPRRIDQVMFFAEGKFISARVPLDPSRVPTSNEARIWYGHGLREYDDTTPPANPPQLKLDDFDDPNVNNPRITLPYFGQNGPNQYAANWTLLRRSDLLVEQQSNPPPRPATSIWSADQWTDNQSQNALQPAQSNIFTFVAQAEPAAFTQTRPIRGNTFAAGGEFRPLTASGLVDIVSGNLTDIRSMILDAQRGVVDPLPPMPQVFEWDRIPPSPPNGRPVTGFEPSATLVNGDFASALAMRRWMRYSLPASPRFTNQATYSAHGGRPRYQLTPPDYLGTISNGGAIHDPQNEFRRTDQVMLTASNFVPGCTEFIVEWSFGNTRPVVAGQARSGELIWYGKNRYSDLNFDGIINTTGNTSPDLATQPYRNNLAPRPSMTGYVNDPLPVAPGLIDGYATDYYLSSGVESPRPWRLDPRIIQEERLDEVLYTTFGYYDASFAPDSMTSFNAPGQPSTMPVPWPKLIRITMSIVDPTDPSGATEQTLQFVFEVPEAKARGQSIN